MDVVATERRGASIASLADVSQTARSMLARHSHFRGRADRFEFVVDDCILQVRGRVPSFYLKQVLQTVLQGVAGIRRIDNRVEVVSVDGLSSMCGDDR
jgi:hypothetical protein